MSSFSGSGQTYWPALGGGWLWDDEALIPSHSNLHSFSGLWNIWFTSSETDYWPLTWSFLWIEWHLWGNQPLGYHISNLALHLLSGFLIWNILSRLGLRWGWLAALLFTVHPLCVESVAWSAEIKNTLSLPLLLLSMEAFIENEEHKSVSTYVRSILFYLAAMLAKTSVVMLPFILLVYCWWKRRQITFQDLKKIIPYMAIALTLGLVTLYCQNRGTLDDPIAAPNGLATRIIMAGAAIYFYFGKFLLPLGLVPFYPPWSWGSVVSLQWLCFPFLVLLFSLLLVSRVSIARHVVLGLSFFVINLMPVVGILPMVYANISWVADHLVYCPMIGLIGLFVAGCERFDGRGGKAGRVTLRIIICIVSVCLAVNSHLYAALFQSKESIFTHIVKYNPNAWTPHNDLGMCLFGDGKLKEALAQFDMAVQLNPNSAKARQNLGVTYYAQGHVSEAIEQLQKAVQLNPNMASAHNDLGLALSAVPSRKRDAIVEYEAAINLDPNYAEARENLALAVGKTSEGSQKEIAQYRETLKNNPNSVMARYNYEKAILSLNPDDAIAHNNLGSAFLQMPGRLADAIAEYRSAVRISPNFAGAQFDLANALLREPGGLPEAVAHLKLALQIDPKLEPARKMLDQLHALYPGLKQ